MKKHIIIGAIFLFVVIVICYQYLYKGKEKIYENKSTIDSTHIFTHKRNKENVLLNSAVDVEKNDALAQSEKLQTSPSLTPQDITTWLLWAEPRGYFSDQMLSSDYSVMSRETLLALASQNDPKAHFTLAKSVLEQLAAGKVTRQALDEAINHLYIASALGYTSTLGRLSDVMIRKTLLEPKNKQQYTLDAYKYAHLAAKRGDPAAETSLMLLRQFNAISDEEERLSMISANKTYQEMSHFREQQGLPPFDNNIPSEIKIISEKMRTETQKIKQHLDGNKQ